MDAGASSELSARVDRRPEAVRRERRRLVRRAGHSQTNVIDWDGSVPPGPDAAPRRRDAQPAGVRQGRVPEQAPRSS